MRERYRERERDIEREKEASQREQHCQPKLQHVLLHYWISTLATRLGKHIHIPLKKKNNVVLIQIQCINSRVIVKCRIDTFWNKKMKKVKGQKSILRKIKKYNTHLQ